MKKSKTQADKTTTTKKVFVGAWLTREERDTLKQAAQGNMRNISSELRFRIKPTLANLQGA